MRFQLNSLERISLPFEISIIERFIFYFPFIGHKVLATERTQHLFARPAGHQSRTAENSRNSLGLLMKQLTQRRRSITKTTNGAFVTHRFKREFKLETNISSNSIFFLSLHASATQPIDNFRNIFQRQIQVQRLLNFQLEAVMSQGNNLEKMHASCY